MKKIISLAFVVLTLFVFSGCSKQEPNVAVNDIMEDIKNQIAKDMKAAGVPEDSFKDGKLPGILQIDFTSEESDPMIENMLELLNKEDIEQGIGLVQMMNVKSDQIFVLKAADESKVSILKEALEKQKEKQEQIWSTYLPDQYEKVKNNIIKVNGKYLIYITYDNPEKIEEIFDNFLNEK
ncbi:DUF4358 domain-containing protein [Paramaledivibacter caminithermalis]|uniref:DUF4358 domain-containing protein n=1 Tax=Paramaledivibacter caminithermalis (strain DSM 15212 / CIP 107654 / DViRD3) TaxID=1121301 RepID=A0A1M6LN08_PARC5|nr:DUF4358 domain-containing protein [Paramaledivibacter caminithermalis]SHJ72616.1 protein of unknown function [Paramaledivibacter caminithermalis DSM 15212]